MKSAKSHLYTVLCMIVVVSTMAVLGCKDEDKPEMIIGDWEVDEPICGDGATMEVDDDLEGEARLFFYYEGSCYYGDFKIEVDVVSSQEEYDIDFEYDGSDSSMDFTMECKVDDDELECEGDDMFDGFEWVFERD